MDQREKRRVNRQTEKERIRARIEELILLEADIDQKLLDLEDVKQSINEILHKKQFNHDKNSELDL